MMNKDDEFIAKNFEEISKMKEDILNEQSKVRHTEIKEKEPEREWQIWVTTRLKVL